MKNIILMSMLTVFSVSSFASGNFQCSEKYDNKIITGAVGTTAGAVLTFGAGVGTGLGAVTAVLVGASIGMAPVLGVGVLYGATSMAAMHTDSYIKAKEMIEEAHLEGGLELAKQKLIVAEKVRLQKKLDAKINPKRSKKGQEALTLEQFIAENPIQVKTPLEDLVAQVNKRVNDKVTYDQVAAYLRAKGSDDTLCKDNKPLGRRNLRKHLVKAITGDDSEFVNEDVNQTDRAIAREDESTSRRGFLGIFGRRASRQ